MNKSYTFLLVRASKVFILKVFLRSITLRKFLWNAFELLYDDMIKYFRMTLNQNYGRHLIDRISD